MPDWTKSMSQTYEYYLVDPVSWLDESKIDCILPGTAINRDSSLETLGSASIPTIERLDECYVRIYLVTIQNGITERTPLGTFLVQTPEESFDGKVSSITLDGYTPLIELKEKLMPIGYSLSKGENVMDSAYLIAKSNMRAPVISASSNDKLTAAFVASTDDTCLSYERDLCANSKFELGLDSLSRLIYKPVRSIAALNPVWTYNDDNSSILEPDVEFTRDLYGIPNVVEVVCSTTKTTYYARAVNNKRSSPISTINRGREVVYRETSPSLIGTPTKAEVDEYAEQLLESLSNVELSVSYTHGYCPVKLGDCVMLNYQRAGLTGIKAKVVSQTITCESGCSVSEKAVFTQNMWR